MRVRKTGRRDWQAWEDEYLQTKYPTTPFAEMEEILMRTRGSIKARALEMGLHRDAQLVHEAREAARHKANAAFAQKMGKARPAEQSLGWGKTDLERAWAGLPL